ncbi:BadF/BadG/BcrA/BcrD ATPase family protein [Actinoplanes sp. NPDC089786]|uniref:N-acetylglucosamine kinase n=1 Tax=Actinoplanes sp. NPDC089786 TaxID=3155185 RepID=UPI0034335F53
MDLVLGVDAGATTTRSVLATTDGHVIGRGRAGGANLNSSGRDLADTLRRALGAAVAGADPSMVRLGVLGAAGSAGAGRRVFGTAAVEAWRTMGLPGVPVTTTDLEVAFAAGTWEQQGTLLLSGTGALAARFESGALTHRCDGYGWLLGDEGSAVWIALRALRACLAALDGRGPETALLPATRDLFAITTPPRDPLTSAAAPPAPLITTAAPLPPLDAADPSRDPLDTDHALPGPLDPAAAPGAVDAGREDLAQAILADAFRRPPAELGRLAPAVSALADRGDPVARQICADAAARLLHTFDSVGPPPKSAVVLAGSVLLSPGPVARAVREGLRRRTTTEPSEARDGAGGAAAMAIAHLTGAPAPRAVHARLTSQDQL